jgi:hypothetical protein
MKFANRATRFLIAATLALAPGFTPAFARDAAAPKFKVQALTLEEMMSEYGAGGGGGGSDPGGDTGGGYTPQCVFGVDLDSDGYCDQRGGAVGIVHESEEVVYEGMGSLVGYDCPVTPSSESVGYCEFAVNLGGAPTSITATVALNVPFGGFGLEYNTSTDPLQLSYSQNIRVALRYRADYRAEKSGQRYTGSYVFQYTDTYNNGLSTYPGYQVTGTRVDSSSKWSKTVWKTYGYRLINYRPWF